MSKYFTAIAATLLLFTQAHASNEQGCKALSKLTLENGRILSAEWVAQGEQRVGGKAVDLPGHCRLVGSLNERTSETDGKSYAIGFEIRLPENWNQRFLVQANGGNDGMLVPAFGNFGTNPEPALTQGFAVLSSDAGHRNDGSSLLSGNAFGFDPQARSDYGYNAHVVLTPVAKTIVQKAYGKAPDHSYFMGCSNGGRHAMVAASRLAEHYDGFIAGNPGFNLPKSAVQHAWDIQQLSRLNDNIASAFRPEDMQQVASAVLAACDELDGLRDGQIHDLPRCQTTFKMDNLRCQNEGDKACLSEAQLQGLKAIFDGPRNSKGEALYNQWWFDSGVSGADWRRWKIHGPIAGLPLIATLGAGSLASIFVTPPEPVQPSPAALIDYLKNFDFDKDAPKIYATAAPFSESAMDFMTPLGLERMDKLFQANSKLIVYHGASDGVFSVKDTVDWYQALDKNHHGKAAESVRLFLVPGMNHCSGGPATDQFDMLTAMVEWLEEGKAPDQVIATVNRDNPELPASWSRERSRPLCSFPSVARYKGESDVERAETFYCD